MNFSVGPIDDECPLRFYFSRFQMLFAKDQSQKVYTTGSVPITTNTWYMRWDAPSASDATVIQQFINNAQDVNVYVGPSMNGPFTFVPRFTDRYPNVTDPAGSNTRNPQKRMLYVTLRGGSANRFYKFMLVPEVAITMKMDININNFFVNNFVANVALLLNIPTSRIKIVDVRAGSVIVDFDVKADVTSNATHNATSSKSKSSSTASETTATANAQTSTAAVSIRVIPSILLCYDVHIV